MQPYFASLSIVILNIVFYAFMIDSGECLQLTLEDMDNLPSSLSPYGLHFLRRAYCRWSQPGSLS